MNTNSIAMQKISTIQMTPPQCTLGITDGSERGDYVPQEHMFRQIGRPHHVVNLMFQYYPDLEGWPTQGVKWRGFYRNNELNKGDGYFPLVLEEGGKWGEFFKRQIEDVRAYGQEPQLTLTLHYDTPDETLVRIAKALAPYGRMRIRINHECNGCWFYFNQRWSYKQVSDLFIRFHTIIHEHAPYLKTVACWNGKGEAYNEPEGKAANGGQLTDDQLGPMFKTADIVSYDQYASLHYGWPNPHFDPKNPDEYFQIPLNVWWDLVDEVHEEMSALRGEDTDIEIHEINEDADLLGFEGQAEWISKYYQEAINRNYPWLKNITFYMFRDRGGLGLEQEDVENPEVYKELPSLPAYKKAIDHEMFKLNIQHGDAVNTESVMPLRWVSTSEASGIGITCNIPTGTDKLKITLPTDQNLLINIDREWRVKKPGEEQVVIPVSGEQACIHMFAPPADGRDNVDGAYESVLAAHPIIEPA